ncbi:hypothetical protein DPMN_144402, partial [Dreissena polymorpha]
MELLVSVDIKQTGDDQKEPFLSGLDFLPDGRLVAVDNWNWKCIILDDRLQILGTPYTFNAYPYDVVCLAQCEDSVSSINTSTESDFDRVLFNNKTYTFEESKCTYVPSKNTLVLTDRYAHTVYMFDTVKGTSRAVTNENIQRPIGACVGPGDTVLVCSGAKNSIVHITVDGDILCTYHQIGNEENDDAQNIIGTNLLTEFHEDRKINVTSRVLTRKNVPPPGSHVFQPIGIIFEIIQDTIAMNLLTKFHEDRTVNVASRVKNAPPLGSHFFKANIIIFKLIQDIIETNLLTKCHEDLTKNVASRVLTRKMPRPWWPDIIGTNLLTKFHDDRKIHVTSRVLTRKIAPPPWWPYIIRMNLLTEFHEDRTINVASRVKNAPPLGGHVFQANVTIFELIQDIIKTNLLYIFHQDWTINWPLEYIIGINLLTKFHEDWTINVASRVKNAPPLCSHFHEDRKINVASRVLTRKNAPPPGGHVFQPTGIIFKLVHDIIRINLLTMFYEDRKMNVASREKCPAPWQPCFSSKRNHFKTIQDIIKTNLLTKFHEDWTINVAYEELTRQMLTPHNAQRTTDDGQKAITKAHHEHVVLRLVPSKISCESFDPSLCFDWVGDRAKALTDYNFASKWQLYYLNQTPISVHAMWQEWKLNFDLECLHKPETESKAYADKWMKRLVSPETSLTRNGAAEADAYPHAAGLDNTVNLNYAWPHYQPWGAPGSNMWRGDRLNPATLTLHPKEDEAWAIHNDERGWQICGGFSQINAECRDVDNHTLTVDALSGQLAGDILDEPCTTAGIFCRDSDQSKPRKCANYAIRFMCS